ncbi:NAD(P)/FAD-dependent oxidoreductase [Caulobacter sp. LARHSG274]
MAIGETVVIGAGVIGLACAAELARRGHEVLVLESQDIIGGGISSRNSEVVHGGMYYPEGSLKAKHCVAGRRLIYEYCADRSVAHRKATKLIVATSESEVAKLESIAAQGGRNGVEGLEWLDGHQALALEPALSCLTAILSRETGIVDTHGLMLALQGEIEDAGGTVVFRTPVVGVAHAGGGFIVRTGGAEPFEVTARVLVNAAGLQAPAVALGVEGLESWHAPRQWLAKGNYFSYAGPPAFSRLIYPAPVDGGLGTHVTIDLAGRMRFGPDVEWVDSESYAVNDDRADGFYGAIRRYWPGLPEGSLVPDYAGIRPKLTGPGGDAADFVLQGPEIHGLAGLVNLFGIESPGLTSALSIAREVADKALGAI